MILLLGHQKGGVGKSNTAVNLAVALAQENYNGSAQLMQIPKQQLIVGHSEEKKASLNHFHAFAWRATSTTKYKENQRITITLLLTRQEETVKRCVQRCYQQI